MGRINRGNTTKLSIKLSARARQNIDAAKKNLNLSAAGVILFELTKIMDNPPSRTEVLSLESKIDLENRHFPLTINKKISEMVNKLADDYDMKKNVLFGLIVSNHFENMDIETRSDANPDKLFIQVNEQLKKKMIDYSEENYIAMSGLVSYAILQGPYEGFPRYEGDETGDMFTSVPSYIKEIVKRRSQEMNIREHFFISLCLYKQFLSEEGRFT
ncbi:hypothetical protein [Fictibacillus sp. NRS-1165]|uniref:hypothetical protein n=1 Tax=Fictibacillus sp. NRS-1165 TaxID=3144463 RepID=UPI003D2116C2